MWKILSRPRKNAPGVKQKIASANYSWTIWKLEPSVVDFFPLLSFSNDWDDYCASLSAIFPYLESKGI